MRTSTKIIVFAIFFAVLNFVYLPSMDCPFVYDDFATIVYNTKIQSGDALTVLGENPFRSLVNATFGLQFQVHQSPDTGMPYAEPFRVVNIIIHFLNALILFMLIRKWKPDRPDREVIAAAAAGLFLFHPLATESVNLITARFTLMMTAFYLLAVYFYIAAEKRPALYYAFAACFFLGLVCKEEMATLPLALLVINRVRHQPQRWVMHCLIAAALYIGLRLMWRIELSGQEQEPLPIHLYFLAENKVLWIYLFKLLYPTHLNFDAAVQSDALSCLPFLVVNILVVSLAAMNYRGEAASMLLLYIIPLLPSSLIPLGETIKEYRVYPSTAVGVATLTVALFQMTEKVRSRPVLIGIIALLFAGLTMARNQAWTTDIALWKDTVSRSPDKLRPVYNLGESYKLRLDLDRALHMFQWAERISPQHEKVKKAISIVEDAKKRPEEVEKLRQKLFGKPRH